MKGSGNGEKFKVLWGKTKTRVKIIRRKSSIMEQTYKMEF